MLHIQDCCTTKPWFFGSISRSEAEYFLSLHKIEGGFLLRNAGISGNDTCLSILASDGVGGPQFRHLLVVKNEQNFYKIDSLPPTNCEMFDSLPDLVEFYSEHEIHFHDSGPSITLTDPCRGKKVLSIM